MVLKKWFKDKQTETEVEASRRDASTEPLVNQLALRIRGAFDLDEILQLVANSIGEQLKVDHCLVYLCDPNVDTLRWRAGYQEPELAPLRWPLRESDFVDLFARVRRGEIVRVSDPLHDSLVASARSRFESAGVRTLAFVPAYAEQLEAVIILGQVSHSRQWSEQELHLLETVAAEVAVAARHITLSSALRRAGSQVASATAELQTENQYLQGLNQLLLLPLADLPQVLNHITESLADLYCVKVCSIEELQPPSGEIRSTNIEIRNVSDFDIRASDFPTGTVAVVRSMRLSGNTTDLGVFPIQGSSRQQVVESAGQRTVFNAAGVYPEDRFLQEHSLNFYAGTPIVNRAGSVIGLLNLFHSESVNLQKRDLKALAAIARRVGFELEDERALRARQEAEHEIKWRLEAATQWEEQMKFLQEARELLRTSDRLETGLQELVISANRHMGSDFAAIALYDLEATEAQSTQRMGGGEEEKENVSVSSAPPEWDSVSPWQIRMKQLITAGIDAAVREAIGDLPTGRGLLGVLTDWTGPLRLDNLAHHPRFTGFPANHPVMRSFLAVPLRVRGTTVGAIYFADKNDGEPFSSENELFASELAAQIALAVAAPAVGEGVKGWKGEGVKESEDETLTHSLPHPLTPSPALITSDWSFFSGLFALMEATTSAEKACTSLVDQLTGFFQGSAAGIWLLEPSTQTLALASRPRGAPTPHQIAGPIQRLADKGPIRLGEGLIGRAAISGQTLAVGDLYQSKGVPDELKALLSPDEPYTSATAIPLKTRDKSLGVMLVFGVDSQPTEKESRSFLEVAAYCLGSFVEQFRMLEEIRSTKSEIRNLSNFEIQISNFPEGVVGDQILNQLADSMDASHAALFLRQSAPHLPGAESADRDLLLFRHRGLNDVLVALGRRISVDKAEDSITMISSGDPIIVAEIEADPRIINRELVDILRAEGLRSGIILPLLSGNELVGLLVLASAEANHFSHYSREFFSILTGRIADALGRAGEWESGRVGERAHAPILPFPHSPTQFFETLLENLSSGVVAIDRDGRITVFNPAMERLIGYRRDEVFGLSVVSRPLSVAEPEEPRTTDLLPLFVRGNPFNDALIQARAINWEEIQVLTRGGGKKYVSLTVSPLADERGALSGAIGVFTDITEIRTLEHERYRLTPLALIGEMSARLAHEIKNPLASMMSGLELLQRRLQYGEKERRYFERLIAELQRLDTTVREMLAYSRTTPPLVASVDPADPLERALDMLMPQLEAGHVTVKRDYQLGLESALMDANQMEQVFLNLIINAIHAMPDGGTLSASLGMVKEATETQRTQRMKGEKEEWEDSSETSVPLWQIEYAISDTGVGIRPDIIDKIFDPFFSTKTHGTGLGLASVKKIIEAHQGHISVESKPGEGTTFAIRLHQYSQENSRIED